MPAAPGVRRRHPPRSPAFATSWASLRRRAPDIAAAAVVVAALAAYFIRPHVMHPHYDPNDPAGHDIVALQAQLGLPAAGPRTYAEQSMHWLAWWLGP